MRVIPTCIRAIIDFLYILTDPFDGENNLAVGLTANDAVKLRRNLLLAGIYYGAQRTRESSITRNRALIIPERIIARFVNAKRCHAQLDGNPPPKAFLLRENISSPAEFEKALGRVRNTLLIRLVQLATFSNFFGIISF